MKIEIQNFFEKEFKHDFFGKLDSLEKNEVKSLISRLSASEQQNRLKIGEDGRTGILLVQNPQDKEINNQFNRGPVMIIQEYKSGDQLLEKLKGLGSIGNTAYFGPQSEGFDKELALKIDCESFTVNSLRARMMNSSGYDIPAFENASKLVGFNAFRGFWKNQTIVRRNFPGIERLMIPPYTKDKLDLFKQGMRLRRFSKNKTLVVGGIAALFVYKKLL